MSIFLRKHYFNLLLPLVLLLAWASRDVALSEHVSRSALQSGAVIVIFLITGFLLPLKEFLAGVANVRLHVWAQSFSFLAYPLAMLAVVTVGQAWLTPEIRQGMLVLAVVPTTVSSCVIYTTLARGNIAGAAFTAIAGNFAGVIISPLLFSLLVATTAGISVDWNQIGSLLLEILVPLLFGLALRTRVRLLPPSLGNTLRVVSGLALLLIIYFAVQSALGPKSSIWRWSLGELVGPVLTLTVFNLSMLAAIWWSSRLSGLPRDDRKTMLFVGSQKTVTVGLPLLHAFYSDTPELMGVVSIPLIIYHPLQLVIAGFVAPRLAEDPEDEHMVENAT